ncbi:trypsin-like serine protease [Capillimicrobium parvum]|uniref:Peptidase S1 domain-containing protein n=1 Tax=Capillimicrobium parvum TaxID=2884022 RepID=A0A9E6XXD2_9ACTN|nr:trypsin-like serine protease [Capillimicrobium parvum]UGS36169.1 hypothetical protein DSM104329_02569 [Capillimicrobium parvum]
MPAGGAAAAPARDSDEAQGLGGVTAVVPAKKAHEVSTQADPPRTTPPKGDEKPVWQAPPAGSIVGGTTAPTGAYPFFVSVQTSGGSHFCGGTLVSSTRVLTAAHCVDGTVTAAGLRVVIGANQLSAPTPQGEIRNVSAIAINPAWNATTFENDVAILTLSSASTKAWSRLAGPGDPTAAGDTVRAIGHGATSEGGSGSDSLLQVDLPIQSDATMSSSSAYGSSFIGAVMIGAGPLAGGMDTCQGDSGGPLFIAGATQHALVGDTSWGTGCARVNHPGIYGEVFQGTMRTFVNNNVPRPANDDFGGSGLSGALGTVFGDNTDATAQPGEPSVPSTADTTVWYSWTAPENGPTTFSLRDAAFDTALSVFTGSSVSGLTTVATNDDFNGTLQSKLTFNASAGTTYRIRVDGFAAAHGPFSLQWAQNPPANDDFAAATTVSGATGRTFGSNARSTGEPGEPSHSGVPDATVWYRWTAPESGPAVLNTRGSDFDTTLAVYAGSAITGLVQLAANDDINGSRQSRVAFTATAGTEYRIAVDGFSNARGNVALQWTVNPPANDDFAQARVLPGTAGITSATSVRATGEPGELDYHGGAAADNSVWFRWTPAVSGPAVLRLGSVSGLSPGMAVYTGNGYFEPLTKVGEGPTSVALNVTAGTPYSIAVDGNGGTTGTFTLEWLIAKCNGVNASLIGQGSITGTAGNDVIVGSAGPDSIDGGGGIDVICGLGANDTLIGGAADDLLFGGPGNDDERGGTGNDTFRQDSAPEGGDRLDGEGGTDAVYYGTRTTGVTVNLNNVADDGAAGEGDNVLLTVENVTGGAGNDKVSGSTAANRLSGAGGNDELRGRGGNDQLFGGPGSDRLYGDGDSDTLNLVDGVSGNDAGNGGAGTDTATADPGDVVTDVP